jgi:hypothetical protein
MDDVLALLQAIREAQWQSRRDILALALRREELGRARHAFALTLFKLQQQQQQQQAHAPQQPHQPPPPQQQQELHD